MAGLDGLIVKADEDALVGLDEDAAASALLAVDGAIVGTEHKVLLASNVEARGTEARGVVEASNEGLGLRARDLEARGSAPLGTIEAEDGALGDEASANEVVVNVRLPRHFYDCFLDGE